MTLLDKTFRLHPKLVAQPGDARRRAFLVRVAGLAGGVLVAPAYSQQPASESLRSGGHQQFVKQAQRMKQQAVRAGDQAYGAIVVKDGVVVGLGPSRVIIRQDPTAHAEMEAIRDAAKRLGTRDLSGCMLYSTSRPCRMCEAAAYWANISRMYFGANPRQGVAPQYGC